MLVMISYMVLSFVIIRFTQHLAGKLILWNKSVIPCNRKSLKQFALCTIPITIKRKTFNAGKWVF